MKLHGIRLVISLVGCEKVEIDYDCVNNMLVLLLRLKQIHQSKTRGQNSSTNLDENKLSNFRRSFQLNETY